MSLGKPFRRILELFLILKSLNFFLYLCLSYFNVYEFPQRRELRTSTKKNSVSPLVRTQHFHRSGLGSVPGWGTKMPQASWRGQKEKKKSEKIGTKINYQDIKSSMLLIGEF